MFLVPRVEIHPNSSDSPSNLSREIQSDPEFNWFYTKIIRDNSLHYCQMTEKSQKHVITVIILNNKGLFHVGFLIKLFTRCCCSLSSSFSFFLCLHVFQLNVFPPFWELEKLFGWGWFSVFFIATFLLIWFYFLLNSFRNISIMRFNEKIVFSFNY